MDIGVPLRELGAVDATALRERILEQDEVAWREQRERQDSFHVHRHTESIVLVFTNNEAWPDIEVHREPGWDRLAKVAVPLMHDLVDRHYPAGGTIIRAMAARLRAGGRISAHADTHPSFHCGHRIHVPITTNPRVRFHIDGRPYRFAVGQAYEINNQLTHSVYNKGSEDRITFIFDYLPPEVLGRRRRQASAS